LSSIDPHYDFLPSYGVSMMGLDEPVKVKASQGFYIVHYGLELSR